MQSQEKLENDSNKDNHAVALDEYFSNRNKESIK